MGVIVDTGPLVAYFDRSERHHEWAVQRIEALDAPLFVCEPVLTEVAYLLAGYPKAQDTLLELAEGGGLRIAFAVDEHIPALRALLRKYRDTPMSFADACVVRMAEIYDRHAVLTLDSDFMIYRKKDRLPLSVIHPAAP